MKRVWNQLTALFVALSLTCVPFARANEYDDMVDQDIKTSFERAKADAEAMAASDFANLNQDIMAQVARYAASQQDFVLYQRLVADIETQLNALSDANLDELQHSEQAVRDFMAKYEQEVRRKFMVSWIPTNQVAEYDLTRNLILGMSSDFKKLCDKGRSIKGWSYVSSPPFAPPQFVSRFDAKISPNFIGAALGGFPLSVGYGYQSATGGSEAANRDRARAVAITMTASNIATNFFIAAKVGSLMGIAAPASGVMGAVSGAMIAAAPYLAAVAVLVMIAVDVQARAEAARLNNQLQNALNKKYTKSADSETVNQFYRESCTAYSNTIDKVVGAFADLSDPAKAPARKAAADGLAADIERWQADAGAMSEPGCQLDLDRLYSQYGCTQLQKAEDVAALKPNQKDPKTLCAIDPEKKAIRALDMQCVIPFNDNERKSLIDEDKQKVDSFNSTYTPDKVMDLISAEVTIKFSDQERLANNWRQVNYDKLDEAQGRAFRQLLRLINLMQQARGLTGDELKLKEEIAVQRQFFVFRDRMLKLGVLGIQVVQGKTAKAPVLKALMDLKSQYASFQLSYRHVQEVMDLGQAIGSLVDQVGAL